jgi:DNA-binding MarR family transcriptional regulator
LNGNAEILKLEDEIIQKQFRTPYHKAMVNLIYTHNWFMDFQNELLKPYGITIQQYNILRILRGQHPKPANIKLIRDRMLDKMSDASRIVEKLRLKDFAGRSLSKTDRRNVDVIITPKGLEVLEKIDQLSYKQELFMSHLTLAEINQLNDLLDKLRG